MSNINLKPVLEFLRKLRRNNNREWFEKHKGEYLIAKNNFESFLEQLHSELVKFDTSLAGLNPRKAAFRIYRDVRFSRDKRPYKTNMGAAFSANGKMEQQPGYYLHLEPGNCFVAGGLYTPDAARLARVRQEIDYNAQVLHNILNNHSFKKYFKGFDRFDELKTAPKGYAKDHPDINLLRLKSYVVSYALSDEAMVRKNAVKNIAAVCHAIKPLNDFFQTALQE